MKQIILLASYPKSGNTWLRVFLSNLLSDSIAPVDINDLSIGWGIDRSTLDQITGIESSDLTVEETWAYLPAVIRSLSTIHSRSPIFIKTHSMNWSANGNGLLFPEDAIKGVVYLVRDPLDVSVSFARHSGWDVGHAISVMNDAEFKFFDAGAHLHYVVTEKVSTWSANVLSWVDRSDIPVHVVRYEDILVDPVDIFSRIVDFCDLPYSAEQIRKASTFSEFSALRAQEDEKGFQEKNRRGEHFFRHGLAGSWQQELSESEAQQICSSHGPTMRRFGYVSA